MLGVVKIVRLIFLLLLAAILSSCDFTNYYKNITIEDMIGAWKLREGRSVKYRAGYYYEEMRSLYEDKKMVKPKIEKNEKGISVEYIFEKNGKSYIKFLRNNKYVSQIKLNWVIYYMGEDLGNTIDSDPRYGFGLCFLERTVFCEMPPDLDEGSKYCFDKIK